MFVILIHFLGHFGCQNGGKIRAHSDPKALKRKKKTLFVSSFWSDLGSILASFFNTRTSDFIGMGGEFVGSAFFTNVPKLYARKIQN